jgi:hypothetical protein
MDSFKDSIAFWATVLGTLLGLFGVIRSLEWLDVIGGVIVVCSVGVLVYARNQALRVKSATLKVGGRSIDSLNMASLRRHMNESLVIQRAENYAVIDGENLALTWKCTGYCKAASEAAIEFSIDADTHIPFAELDCFGYDLRRDPRRKHPIRPILLRPDGISKKIAVPFLAPLAAREPFSVMLKCNLPNCMRAGEDYYTATLSFDQDRIARYRMRLVFMHDRPRWVRAYECRAAGQMTLLRALQQHDKGGGICEYLDTGNDVAGRSARVYMFSRPSPLNEAGLKELRKAA